MHGDSIHQVGRSLKRDWYIASRGPSGTPPDRNYLAFAPKGIISTTPYKNIVIFRKVWVGTEILLHARLRYVQYFLDAYVCTLLCSRCVATNYYNAETRKGGVGQNWRGTCKFLLRSAPGQPQP